MVETSMLEQFLGVVAVEHRRLAFLDDVIGPRTAATYLGRARVRVADVGGEEIQKPS
jgi:hypothetical protein